MLFVIAFPTARAQPNRAHHTSSPPPRPPLIPRICSCPSTSSPTTSSVRIQLSAHALVPARLHPSSSSPYLCPSSRPHPLLTAKTNVPKAVTFLGFVAVVSALRCHITDWNKADLPSSFAPVCDAHLLQPVRPRRTHLQPRRIRPPRLPLHPGTRVARNLG